MRRTTWIIFLLVHFACAFSTTSEAREFVSKEYAFIITIPSAFEEMPDDMPRAIKTFIDASKGLSERPVSIRLKRAGGEFNPATKIDIAGFQNIKGSRFWLETRRWKDLNLEVLASETAHSPQASQIPASWGTLIVEYVIVFPLKGEGIVLVVNGPKSRSEQVLNTFNELVASFVNLKRYLTGIVNEEAKVESQPPVKFNIESKPILELLLKYVLPITIIALVAFWMWGIRKSKLLRRKVIADENQ